MLGWLRKSWSSINLQSTEPGGWAHVFGFGRPGDDDASEISALQVATVFCAVRVIAEGIAQMPIEIKRRTVTGGRARTEPAPDHWAQMLLTRRPNEWQSPHEFVEFLVFSAALAGDALAMKDMPGRPSELIPIPPGSWSLRRERDRSLTYHVTLADGGRATLQQDEVLHLRGPSLDGWRGLRPIALARQSIGLADDLARQQRQTASNGGRPSGVLSMDAPVGQGGTPESRMNSKQMLERIKATWDSAFGARGPGGVAVLDAGWKFQPMQMTAVDAQHIETRKHEIEEIARAFRVFPQMLMQSDKSSTFASAESFFRAHVTHTLGPWIARIEGMLNRDLLGQQELAQGFFVDLDERNLLRGDVESLGNFYTKALGAGGTQAWMTPNEVRDDLGLNPLPGGDRLSAGAMDQPQDGGAAA